MIISTCLVTGWFSTLMSLFHTMNKSWQEWGRCYNTSWDNQPYDLKGGWGDSPVSYQGSLLLTLLPSFDQLGQKSLSSWHDPWVTLEFIRWGARLSCTRLYPSLQLSYSIRLSSKVDQSGHHEPPIWPKLSSILIYTHACEGAEIAGTTNFNPNMIWAHIVITPSLVVFSSSSSVAGLLACLVVPRHILVLPIHTLGAFIHSLGFCNGY